jgi:hypothetical protein
MTNINEFKKLVETQKELGEVLAKLAAAKIKAGYRKTPNGKYIITFFI